MKRRNLTYFLSITKIPPFHQEKKSLRVTYHLEFKALYNEHETEQRLTYTQVITEICQNEKEGQGSVNCNLYDPQTSSLVPSISPQGRIECLVRTRARLINLVVTRGSGETSITGPLDYYGNIERPESGAMSIKIEDGVPSVYRHNHSAIQEPAPEQPHTRSVQVDWIDQQHPNFHAKVGEYTQGSLKSQSLFPNPGIAECQTKNGLITLSKVDVRNIDLTSFKARLVDKEERSNSYGELNLNHCFCYHRPKLSKRI
jgi:hypothetical protein